MFRNTVGIGLAMWLVLSQTSVQEDARMQGFCLALVVIFLSNCCFVHPLATSYLSSKAELLVVQNLL